MDAPALISGDALSGEAGEVAAVVREVGDVPGLILFGIPLLILGVGGSAGLYEIQTQDKCECLVTQCGNHALCSGR